MEKVSSKSMFILGFFIFLGLVGLGFFLSQGLLKYKQLERTVAVKGLSQQEHKANIAIWPIEFTTSSNDISELHKKLDINTKEIVAFLKNAGFKDDEMTITPPSIIDRYSNQYGQQAIRFRYFASRNISIYSKNVDKIRENSSKLIETLSKKGILFKVNDYETKIEYIFTKLNAIKPAMIEEATNNARKAAQKFAKDSKSNLGKIKSARQGQFVVFNRDKNTPYIKTVRIVSTIEYYLDD